ncbi:MAG: IS607 family transposase [Hormoscilla sp.]
MSNHYVTPRVAASALGVHTRTLTRWEAQGKIKAIRTAAGQRRYDLEEYLQRSGIGEPGQTTAECQNSSSTTILYARVALQSQQEQLRRQAADLMAEYPDCEAICEIGSGLNFSRPRFLAMLERVIRGEIACIVVANQDRLVRFGFDLIEWLCRQFGCQILVLDRQVHSCQGELIADLKTIVGSFSGSINGLHKYDLQLRQEFPVADPIDAIASSKTEGGAVGRPPTTGDRQSP